jgi:hypothetical protein
MGEDKLQSLANVRQARVEVRSIVCVQSSSDFGAALPPETYRLSPLSSGRPSRAWARAARRCCYTSYALPACRTSSLFGFAEPFSPLAGGRSTRLYVT